MPDEMSPEDRERLAKVKFKEYFSECLEEVFGDMFDKRVTEMASAKGQQGQQGQSQQQQQQQNGNQQQQPKQRKRSLFDMALQDVLGM